MHRRRLVRSVPGAVLAAGLLFVLIGPPATAATGDVVSTIIADRTGTACASVNPGGDHNGVGVGIAFDGTNLWFSCSSDNSITVLTTAGVQVRNVTVTGTDNIGALAYDGKNNILYGCGGEGDVGTIDPNTGAFTSLFATQGCYDGLAYDGEDNTLWSSPDATNHIEHYSIAGVELSSTSLSGKLGGECGNSGIAVGGSDLFLGNNGCSEIYKATKDLATVDLFIDSTKTGDRRVEDLECDNLTFAATGQAVIWSVDAYDNIVTAYEIPNGTCFFGGGVVPTTTTTTTESTTTTTSTTTAPTTTAPAAAAAAAVRVTPVFTG